MNLWDYIIAKAQAAGLDPNEINNVYWWDEDVRRWRILGTDQVEIAFKAVDVTNVSAAARSKIIISVNDDGTRKYFRWDETASDFVLVQMKDRYFTLEAGDLTS